MGEGFYIYVIFKKVDIIIFYWNEVGNVKLYISKIKIIGLVFLFVNK